jgi:hypothetical protein
MHPMLNRLLWRARKPMPTFVIERDVPGAGRLTDAEIEAISQRSLEQMRAMAPDADVQWLHSYVTDDKIYCIYVAPNPEAIVRHAKLSGVPVDRVAQVRRLLNYSERKV